MSLIYNKFSSAVLFALLMGLLFSMIGGTADAQSAATPPPRLFQMSLWEYSDSTSAWIPTSADSDIRTYYYVDGTTAPPGRFIIVGWPWNPNKPADEQATLSGVSSSSVADWSQVVAVEFDEVYGSLDGSLNSLTCSGPTEAQLEPITNWLMGNQQTLKNKNPKARFWVNFTSAEAQWMADCSGTEAGYYNQSWFDVVSADAYGMDFYGTLYWFYRAVLEHPPQKPASQQVALIPGVYSSYSNYELLNNSNGTPDDGYFTYANTENRTCNLALGSSGVTGIYDKCPVWIVMGFLAGYYPTLEFYGMLDSSGPYSNQIHAIWRQEVALQPARVAQPILQLLLK